MVFPVTAVSMKISTDLEVLRRGQMLTLECQAGSSNPKANISWSLGGLRFVKAFGGAIADKDTRACGHYMANLVSNCVRLR